MPLSKKTYDWAVTGTKTTPSAARQQSGWVAGEQPTVGDENWIQGGQDIALRELQTGDNPETTSEAVDQDEFAKHVYNNDTTAATESGWAYPWSAKNIYTAPTASDTLVDMCVSYPTGVKRLFALETNTGEVQVIDPVEGSLNYTISNATLVAGLPATGGAWLPLSMCSDESYLYILFEETGVGVGTERHYVQSYDNGGLGVHPSWPASGTQITSGVLAATSWTAITNRTSKIIFARPGVLQTLNGWVGAVYAAGYSASTPFTSSLGSATGGLGVEGGGDVSSVANYGTLYPTGAIASDGNSTTFSGIYFAVADQTNFRGIMCSAQSGNEPSGTGYTVFPIDFGSTNRLCQSATYDGEQLIAPVRVLNAVTGGWFYHFDPVTATTADSLTTDPDYPSPREVAVDGLNMYLSSRVGDNPGGAHTNTLHNTVLKADLSGLFPSAVYTTITSAVNNRFNMEKVSRNNTGTRDANVDYFGPMLFDGRDLWVIQDIRSSTTSTTFGGRIFRIPRVAVR
jgi:hypothetical protein